MEPKGQLVCSRAHCLTEKDATLVSIQNPNLGQPDERGDHKPGIIPLRKEGDGRATRCPESPRPLPGVGAMAVDGGVSFLMPHHLSTQSQKEKGKARLRECVM